MVDSPTQGITGLIKRRRGALAVIAAALLVAALFGASLKSDDEGELSQVDLSLLRLLDDGAGQRYFELSYPRGRPRATMIFIHGGAWRSHGLSSFWRMRSRVDELVDAGFRVLAISTDESPALSHPRAQADGSRVLDDVLAFYDQAADAFPAEPICAQGISGGGHLALMLAIRRPGLACVTALAPPTDLVELAHEAGVDENPERACKAPANGVEAGACFVMSTWGNSRSKLRRASPAALWPETLQTPIWAAFERDDPVIPTSQREALAAAVSEAVIEVVRNASKGPLFAHSFVDASDEKEARRSLMRWLDDVVPPLSRPAELPDEDLLDGTHLACNSRLARGPSWRTARRRDRSELLSAAGRWRPQAGSGVISATNSCDGRKDSQQAGLSLSVPGFAAAEAEYVEKGESAAWVFTAPQGSSAQSLTASFRGYIANPRVWRLGLYERQAKDGKWSPVVECDGSACDRLELQGETIGSAIIPAASKANAGETSGLPQQTFSLESAVELKWELKCIARRGCVPRSINAGADPDSGDRRRPIDPAGRPAVLSIYELEVETAEG